jgi:hypothetical protein
MSLSRPPSSVTQRSAGTRQLGTERLEVPGIRPDPVEASCDAVRASSGERQLDEATPVRIAQ